MKINKLLVSICLLAVSCSPSKKAMQTGQKEQITLTQIKYSKKEALHLNIWRMLESYTYMYAKCPKNANDLIMLIERSDRDYRLINDNVYQFLKKNKDNLIFFTSADSVTTIYNGKIKESRIVERADYIQPCDYMASNQVYFFDETGLYVCSDTLSTLVIERLFREYWSYFYITKDNSDREIIFEKTKFEYTSGSLKNLCRDEFLDIEQSPLIKTTFSYLDSLAQANSFSRIIASGFIDN